VVEGEMWEMLGSIFVYFTSLTHASTQNSGFYHSFTCTNSCVWKSCSIHMWTSKFFYTLIYIGFKDVYFVIKVWVLWLKMFTLFLNLETIC